MSRTSLLLLSLLVLPLPACKSFRTDPEDAAVFLEAGAPDVPRPGDRAGSEPSPPPADLTFSWPDLPADRPLKDLEGLQGTALRDALYGLVAGHTYLSYTKAKAAIFVPSAGGIDVHDGIIECIYTGLTVAADGNVDPGNFNVEHSWPQSEGANTVPAESDLNHLFPSDANANSHRSSLNFGDTACAGASCKWEQGGSKIGPSVVSGSTVFQVRPAKRGDIARAHLYFSVRYKMGIPAEEEQALRVWNVLDPPDEQERARASAIEAIQKKRNPFVDRPDFAQHITDF